MDQHLQEVIGQSRSSGSESKPDLTTASPEAKPPAKTARCASCAGGADPDRVLAVAGTCACGARGPLYSVAEPTAAAMRATVALFGAPDESAAFTFTREWMAKRAAVIDRETGLPAFERLLAAAKEVRAGLNARIVAAPADAVPLFDGIADLHSAIEEIEARR